MVNEGAARLLRPVPGHGRAVAAAEFPGPPALGSGRVRRTGASGMAAYSRPTERT